MDESGEDDGLLDEETGAERMERLIAARKSLLDAGMEQMAASLQKKIDSLKPPPPKTINTRAAYNQAAHYVG
eukprot:8574689-Alexandrium_andersonii.AAC.1